MITRQRTNDELVITYTGNTRTNLEGIEKQEEIKNLKLNCDYFCEEINLHRLKELINLEKLTIRVRDSAEYEEEDPQSIWPFLFDFYPYGWDTGYTEDDIWRLVYDEHGNHPYPKLDLKPVGESNKLEILDLQGPHIEIETFEPLVKCQRLKKIKLSEVEIKTQYDKEEEFFDTLKDCKNLVSIEIGKWDNRNINIEKISERIGKSIIRADKV